MSVVDVSQTSRQTPSSLLPELPHLVFGFLLLPLLHPVCGPRSLVLGAPRATDDRLALAAASALRRSTSLRLNHPAPFCLRHRHRSDAGMLPAYAAPGEAQVQRTGAWTAHISYGPVRHASPEVRSPLMLRLAAQHRGERLRPALPAPSPRWSFAAIERLQSRQAPPLAEWQLGRPRPTRPSRIRSNP